MSGVHNLSARMRGGGRCVSTYLQTYYSGGSFRCKVEIHFFIVNVPAPRANRETLKGLNWCRTRLCWLLSCGAMLCQKVKSLLCLSAACQPRRLAIVYNGISSPSWGIWLAATAHRARQKVRSRRSFAVSWAFSPLLYSCDRTLSLCVFFGPVEPVASLLSRQACQ